MKSCDNELKREQDTEISIMRVTWYSHFVRDQRDSFFHDFSIAHVDPGNRSDYKDRFFPRCSRDRRSQEDHVEIVAIVLRLQTNLVRDRCREAESVIPICNFRAVLGHLPCFSHNFMYISDLDIFPIYLAGYFYILLREFREFSVR